MNPTTDAVHHCHAIGCDKPISPRLLMCYAHWRATPLPLRKEVWKQYRRGQEVDKRPTDEYVRAAMAAVRAVATQERGGA